MSVVFWKELADHFSSRRFMILLVIIVLSALWATYATGTFFHHAQYAPLRLKTCALADVQKSCPTHPNQVLQHA